MPLDDDRTEVDEIGPEQEVVRLRALLYATNARAATLEGAIRKHRDATGHAMCWENDQELWRALGDGFVPDRVPPHLPEFMGKCAAYWQSRQPPPTTTRTPTVLLAALNAERIVLGWSQERMASEIGISRSAMQRWAYGNSCPSAQALLAAEAWLARHLAAKTEQD